VTFTQPTVGLVESIDPWRGYLGSAAVPAAVPAAVAANQVLGSLSDNALGENGGGGVVAPLGRNGVTFFAEVRYHWVNTPMRSTAVTPVAFGVRVGASR
jgi:hypothetical protein